ncbi:hypothetical protein J3R82DRAFT_9942 [Butyriboletus roseoflavus]|nr:hypothetical protein J3R82DRAFT_9942 [Butyriboletus roseoflavus]
MIRIYMLKHKFPVNFCSGINADLRCQISGVTLIPIDLFTDDGYDLQFGTNVLGHFYFTKLVLPILLSTTNPAPDGIARVTGSPASSATP